MAARTTALAISAGLLLALSGCFDKDPPASPEPTSPVPPVPSVPSPNGTASLPVAALPPFVASLIDLERPGHEPVVAVAPDGTIFVHARGVRNGTAQPDTPHNNFLWRSRDAGETFERVGSAAMERDTPSEGTVAVLDSGRVLVAYSMMPDGSQDASGVVDRRVEIHASDDGGDTWRELSVIPLPSAHRTWLWPAGERVHLGAMSYNNVFHWESADGGASWDGPNRVHDYNTYNGRLVGNGDTLLWPWFTGMYEQAPGDADLPWVLDAHTSSDHRAWVPHPVGTVEGRATVFAGATVDANGTFYLTWATSTPQESTIWMASSPDGADWTLSVVDEGPGIRVIPWVASPAAGTVGLAWYQNDEASGDPLTATGAWYAQYARVTRADSAQPMVDVVRPVAQPILEGPLCLQAFSCGDVVRDGEVCFTPLPDPVGDCQDLDHLRNYDDYVGIEYRDGKAVMAFVTTQGHGLPTWEPGEPGHILVVRET